MRDYEHAVSLLGKFETTNGVNDVRKAFCEIISETNFVSDASSDLSLLSGKNKPLPKTEPICC